MDWDVFISHAWEDKESFGRPLAKALEGEGLRVWFDEFTLHVGDSLRRSIDYGLANSRYGVVILSPNFFAKEWPQKELDGLAAREISSEKVILPVWHNITADQIRKYSPTLADRIAVKSEHGLEYVVKELLRVIKPTPELSQLHKLWPELTAEAKDLTLSLMRLIGPAKSKQEIIDDIKGHTSKGGGGYSAWYVGISKDARDRLFSGHKVKKGDRWIHRTASSAKVAREIEDYFVNTLGTDGGPGGGAEDAKQVYAYKKAAHTDP